MQTTYRLKAKEISMAFLNSLKALFEGKEVEITVKAVEQEKEGMYKKETLTQDTYNMLLQMIRTTAKTHLSYLRTWTCAA